MLSEGRVILGLKKQVLIYLYRYCHIYIGMLFVRLTLYNSDDLVANLNRSLYLLI